MSNLFICTRCGRSQPVPPPNEARRESWRKAGFTVPADDQRVCADCLAWMLDVERICRSLAQQSNRDPDEWMGEGAGAAPLWTTYIGVATLQTNLPCPDRLRGQDEIVFHRKV